MQITKTKNVYIDKMAMVALSALLVAVFVVFNRFLSIRTPIVIISFSFVPVMVAAFVMGRWWAALVAGLGDFIGAMLWPFGTFFFGFTLSWILSGIIYGEFLYHAKERNKKDRWLLANVIISSIIVLFTMTMFLNTYWLYVMWDRAFWPTAGTRAIASAIMTPIQIVAMFLILKFLREPVEKFLVQSNADNDPDPEEIIKTEETNDKT